MIEELLYSREWIEIDKDITATMITHTGIVEFDYKNLKNVNVQELYVLHIYRDNNKIISLGYLRHVEMKKKTMDADTYTMIRDLTRMIFKYTPSQMKHYVHYE